jgi:hypothetical protein
MLAGAGYAGWQNKAYLLALINPPRAMDTAAEKPDVVYSWVDKEGVTHYQQDAAKGARTEYDGSRITRLEPIPPEVLARAEAAAKAAEEAAKPKGSEMLHQIRNEALETQQKVKQWKEGGDI